MVLRHTLKRARTVVCEPMLQVALEVPTESAGATLSLIARTGGVVESPSPRAEFSVINLRMSAASVQRLASNYRRRRSARMWPKRHSVASNPFVVRHRCTQPNQPANPPIPDAFTVELNHPNHTNPFPRIRRRPTFARTAAWSTTHRPRRYLTSSVRCEIGASERTLRAGRRLRAETVATTPATRSGNPIDKMLSTPMTINSIPETDSAAGPRLAPGADAYSASAAATPSTPSTHGSGSLPCELISNTYTTLIVPLSTATATAAGCQRCGDEADSVPRVWWVAIRRQEMSAGIGNFCGGGQVASFVAHYPRCDDPELNRWLPARYLLRSRQSAGHREVGLFSSGRSVG